MKMDRAAQVAIVTRTRNRPVFLRRAIQSVLSQSVTDWIHVIVNDGGDAAVVDGLLLAFRDAYAGRVQMVHHDHSKGMQNASNAGLEASRSTYVVIHDDDDSWYPDFLEKTIGHLELLGPDDKTQAVVTQSTQVVEEVCLNGEIKVISQNPYYPFDFVNLAEMRRRNLFPPIALLYRRAVHDKVGFFRQEYDVLGDHDFNLRLLRHYNIDVLSTAHAYYHWRYHSLGNTVTRSRNVHRQMLNRLKNDYAREYLAGLPTAVGSLDGIEFPPPDGAIQTPFRLRTDEPVPLKEMPDWHDFGPFEVFSIDIFDTVLRRRTYRPRDVFKFLEVRAVEECGLPRFPYAMIREEAEYQARKRFQPEVSLQEIYDLVSEWTQLKPAQAKELMQLEIAIERELLYPDPRWLALYRQFKEEGVRVVFVSDMYHSSATIRSFLEDCGFNDPEVFVSNELQCSKHEGKLQHEVADRLGVEASRILHVGDNFHSDCLRSWQAGWHAFHWTRSFSYTPWFMEVPPYQYNQSDLLSLRIAGELERLGLLDSMSGQGSRGTKLGREVAGPFYLSFMMWVLRQARQDGVRKLILLGRDGFYWEKALKILREGGQAEIDFSYLHSSRKVLNFASFTSLDSDALEFLLTPNPSLRVRDFIDRIGLAADDCLALLEHVGFSDPDEVLTTDSGGDFLNAGAAEQLRDLFLLLKPELEALFAQDRRGMLQALDKVGYDPADCALVDIGWNASCARSMVRLLGLKKPDRVLAYFFGTWDQADPGPLPITIRSYFMHLGEPMEHAQLLRESVNWIESLSAAPYPTLVAFQERNGAMEPQFAESLRSGFSAEEQDEIWSGAEAFLRAMLEKGLPGGGDSDGVSYLNLVLNRVLREPSPAEVDDWRDMLHSEGFGLEVYKPLIEQVDNSVGGDELIKAYHASNWKKGFLSSLPENQRDFILQRVFRDDSKSVAQLEADLNYKTRQADQFWSEKERFKWEASHFQERCQELEKAVARLEGDCNYKSQQANEFWAEKEQNRAEAKSWEQRAQELEKEKLALTSKREELQRNLAEAMSWQERAKALEVEKQALQALRQTLERDLAESQEKARRLQESKNQLQQSKIELQESKNELQEIKNELQESLSHEERKSGQLESQLEAAESRLRHLESLLQHRRQLLKVLFSGKVPPAQP